MEGGGLRGMGEKGGWESEESGGRKVEGGRGHKCAMNNAE